MLSKELEKVCEELFEKCFTRFYRDDMSMDELRLKDMTYLGYSEGFKARDKINSEQVQLLLKTMKNLMLECDYMYEQLGNKERITKVNKEHCSVARAYQDAKQALERLRGDL